MYDRFAVTRLKASLPIRVEFTVFWLMNRDFNFNGSVQAAFPTIHYHRFICVEIADNLTYSKNVPVDSYNNNST